MLTYAFGLVICICIYTKPAYGIDCYICTSDQDGCGEKADGAKLILNGNIASGCMSCTKTFTSLGTIWSNVIRACGNTAEDSCTNVIGYGSCSCTTTYCNSSPRTSSSTTVVPLVVLALLLHHIL